MSYNPPPPYAAPPPVPGSQPQGPRPTTVTAAAGLLVGEAVLLLISGIYSFISRDAVQDATDKYLQDQGTAAPSGAEGIQTAASVFGIVLGLAFAAAFVALAFGVLRGANVARIITWVVAGLAMCCFGFGSIYQVVGGTGDFLPSGYRTVTTIISVLQLIGYIGIVVLLALPASNAFFRKPKVGY